MAVREGGKVMIQIDMQMPENCRMCPVCSEYDICLIPVDGKGFGEQNVSEFTEGRPEWCPLKEQEAATIKKTKEHGFGVYGGICPKCRNWIQSAHLFCGFCGQAVKWE